MIIIGFSVCSLKGPVSVIRTSPVFSRLHGGKNVYGMLNSLPSPMLCEMLAFAGYDFVSSIWSTCCAPKKNLCIASAPVRQRVFRPGCACRKWTKN